jgi:hypothetical protein
VTPKVAALSTRAPVTQSRIPLLAWLAALILALVFLIWTSWARIERISYVSGLFDWSGESSSSFGIPASEGAWTPRLIIPEHNNSSYEWLDQTRQMFARDEWRVRHIDYENAPFGRDVFAASPYRWWLGLIAGVDHAALGHPLGESLERAALVADPLLLCLVILGTGAFVARRFGAVSAAILSLAMVACFPFAAQFLPGAPDDQGFAGILGIWSILTLVVGLRVLHSGAPAAASRARRWFCAAGVVGGLGLWANVGKEVPILAGLALGALVAAWVSRIYNRGASILQEVGPLWRTWAFSGTVTAFLAYLIEFFPSHMGSWELRAVHPLLGLAWLGAGEGVAQASGWIQGTRSGRSGRNWIVGVLALIAIGGIPLTLWLTHSWGFLAVELPAMHLARLPDVAGAPNLKEWIRRDGFTPIVWATLLPLFILGPAIWLIKRGSTAADDRIALSFALGPIFVAVGFACFEINWWNGVDAALLILVVVIISTLLRSDCSKSGRWAWGLVSIVVIIPGAIQLLPLGSGPKNGLSQVEAFGLIERDLARWLRQHMGNEEAVVLATPNQTTTLYYYGGLKGLGTLDWENREGLGAAVRILSATTPEEAFELINRRGVTHIIIPSWDSYLDVYTQLGLGKMDGSFMDRLHHWTIPPWLRPVSYLLPTIEGFEGATIIVFEVVDDQDDAVAWSRLAQYFIDSGQLDYAAGAGQTLRRFPGDLGALVARAQVEIARGDTETFNRTVATILPRITAGRDRRLPWDRRVSLAIVLAQAQHLDEARSQLQRCVAEVDGSKLRSLSTTSLYHMQVLAKALGLQIQDPELRELSLDLLPADVRNRFNPQNVQ